MTTFSVHFQLLQFSRRQRKTNPTSHLQLISYVQCIPNSLLNERVVPLSSIVFDYWEGELCHSELCCLHRWQFELAQLNRGTVAVWEKSIYRRDPSKFNWKSEYTDKNKDCLLHLSPENQSLRYSTTYQAWQGLTNRLRRFLAQWKTICSSSAAPESKDQKVPKLRIQVITCQSFYKDNFSAKPWIIQVEWGWWTLFDPLHFQ